MKGHLFVSFMTLHQPSMKNCSQRQLSMVKEPGLFNLLTVTPLSPSICVSVHSLQCYKCNIGFFDMCITSKVTCQGGEQCFSGVGKAGKELNISLDHILLRKLVFFLSLQWNLTFSLLPKSLYLNWTTFIKTETGEIVTDSKKTISDNHTLTLRYLINDPQCCLHSPFSQIVDSSMWGTDGY